MFDPHVPKPKTTRATKSWDCLYFMVFNSSLPSVLTLWIESGKVVFQSFLSNKCYSLYKAQWHDFHRADHIMKRVSPAMPKVVENKACVSDESKSVIDIFGKRQMFPHFLWGSCCTNYCSLLYPHLPNVLNQQSATQKVLSLPSLEVFILSFDLFSSLSADRRWEISAISH